MIEIILFFIFCIFFQMMKTTHPLVMCALLISNSFFIGIFFAIWTSKWLCYSVFLVFLGGMMVIFLYVSSLSFSSKILIINKIPMSLMILLISLYLFKELYKPIFEMTFIPFLSQLYQPMSSGMLSFLMGYLLIILFSVVKITESFKGALLKMW